MNRCGGTDPRLEAQKVMLNEPHLCVTGEELLGDMHADQKLHSA
jgi:hypothetical protein